MYAILFIYLSRNETFHFTVYYFPLLKIIGHNLLQTIQTAYFGIKKLNIKLKSSFSFIYICVPHLILGLLERVRVIIGVLIGRNYALLATRHLRIEALDLLRSGQRVLQLGHRRQQPRSVHPERAVRLAAQSELDGEEVQLPSQESD